MAEASNIKILDHFWVAPPAGAVPPTSLPLTLFDLPWLSISPVTRLFFYEHPYPTHHFLQTILPNFKNSLSLTLHHFFPFAANLICPPKPQKPHILYADGNGAVSLTVAESAADLAHLAADYPRDVRDLHPLTPELPSGRYLDNGSRELPLMAIQVTICPCSGFSIGIIFNHVVADGRAFHHFMKSWASICRTRELLKEQEPLHDRVEIEDINGFQQSFLSKWWNEGSILGVDKAPNDDISVGKVRATIILRQDQIQNLKCKVSDRYKKELATTHVSTFGVVCSLIWVCLLESQDGMVDYSDDDELCYCVFSADCRDRYEFSISKTYFGNCITISLVPLKRKKLVGEFGLAQALRAIGTEVKELNGGALKGAEKWMMSSEEIKELGQQVMIVAASPKCDVYKTDFGLEKLKKTEHVHVDRPGNISLSESRDEEGGVEVGLALPTLQTDNFNAIIKQYLHLN